VHNENSFLNSVATLDNDCLLGLGMSGPMTFGDDYFRGARYIIGERCASDISIITR
jgi:hypothetical protein